MTGLHNDTPEPYVLSLHDVDTATSTSDRYQYPFTLGGLEARGAYALDNPNHNSTFSLNEPLSLANRLPEDIHLIAPQAPPTAPSRGTDIYVQHRGPYDCQQYEDVFDAPHAPPPFPRREMLPLPQAQWSPGSLLYGSAPSSSAPRSCWAPNGSPRYAPPIPAPPAYLNPSGVQIGHFMCLSSFDAPRTGVENEAPPSAPIPPRSTTQQFVAQPSVQALPMPRYGGLGLGYDGIPMRAESNSSHGQQMAPGWLDTSLRDRSNYQELRTSRREGADPFAPQTARSGQKAKSTLATKKSRTSENDRGHEDIAGLFTDRFLPLPLQGPDAPPPTTGARGSKKAKRTKRIRRSRTAAPAPAPAPAPQLALEELLGMSLPWPDPSVPARLDNGKWGCPYDGCNKSYAHAGDAKRHYASAHGGVDWKCRKCGALFTRRDNTRRHVESSHGIKEEIDRWVMKIKNGGEQEHVVGATVDGDAGAGVCVRG